MDSKKTNKVDLILYDSYIQAIKNSVGSNLFKNLFAKINDGPKKDILNDGRLSCAFFASSLLYVFKLISDIHATVNGTIEDLEKSGWIESNQPREGAVIVWEPQEFEGEMHRHIGFYVGSEQAISNNTSKNVPALHHWTFGEKDGQPIRRIEKIYWNDKLN